MLRRIPNQTWRSLGDTTLQNTLIPSIEKTISTSDRSKYDFRLYLAADHDDQFWLNNQNNIRTPDWLSVHVGFYEVPEHKIPFNPMMRAAYNDGAEYMVRINDDSEFVTSDWVSKAVANLASYDPPNVGMVGPNCREGNSAIMTHDMVHRTHLDIFEHYYPDVFSAWWVDDWISKVYGPQRSTKMMDWTVKHHFHKHGTRYEIQHHEAQLLKAELEKGATKIETWLLGLTKFKQNCENIQRKIKENSWNSLSKTLKDSWKTLKCEKSLIVKTPAPPPSILKKCLLVANGPSLNKQTWDFTDDMDYILGMNKIYLGLNKYSLPLNTYVVVNPLVAEQSVDPILHKLDATTEKFVTINHKNKFPTGSDIKFFKSGGPVFSHTLETMNEGWTVTYVGLQILYIKGCQTVYIVGMDHNYKQQGAPNSMQTMKGDDPNHFDSSYFKGNQWHLADLKQNEKHYNIARDEYEKDGRQIIDATIDGHCTVFEKIKSMKDAKTPSITQKCKNVVEWKKSHGWDVCRDVISDNCVIYAMGIGRFSQWDQMMSEPPYNCEVHSFDPTPTGKKHVKSLKNPGFIYHEMGVGLIDGYQDVFVPSSGDQFTKTSTTARNGLKPTTISIPVKKIKTIMRELGHASLDMLKIDIEGGEIEILRDLFSSPVDIKSVCAEFHSESPLPLNEIDQLMKNAGYVPYIPWKSVRVYLGVHLGERCWFKSPAKINPTAKEFFFFEPGVKDNTIPKKYQLRQTMAELQRNKNLKSLNIQVATDTQCIESKKIFFMGDSIIRNLFFQFIRELNDIPMEEKYIYPYTSKIKNKFLQNIHGIEFTRASFNENKQLFAPQWADVTLYMNWGTSDVFLQKMSKIIEEESPDIIITDMPNMHDKNHNILEKSTEKMNLWYKSLNSNIDIIKIPLPIPNAKQKPAQFKHQDEIWMKKLQTISDSNLPQRVRRMYWEKIFDHNLFSNYKILSDGVHHTYIIDRIKSSMLLALLGCKHDYFNVCTLHSNEQTHIVQWPNLNNENAFSFNACSNKHCVPVQKLHDKYVATFKNDISDISIYQMWKGHVDWQVPHQQTSYWGDYSYGTQCDADNNFVNTKICNFKTTPKQMTLTQEHNSDVSNIKQIYVVGDSNMKRINDQLVHKCNDKNYIYGKLHKNINVNCGNIQFKYILNAGVYEYKKDAPLQPNTTAILDTIPDRDDIFVIFNTGHNYINMNPDHYRKLLLSIRNVIYAKKWRKWRIVSNFAFNTEHWKVGKNSKGGPFPPSWICMRNNVRVQNANLEIRKIFSSTNIIDTFWKTLHSGLSIDGIHFNPSVYKDISKNI